MFLVPKLRTRLPQMLCAFCIAILQKGVPSGTHYNTISDLRKAADTGCRICRGLERLCRNTEDINASILSIYDLRDGSLRFDVWIPDPSDGMPSRQEILVFRLIPDLRSTRDTFEGISQTDDDAHLQPWNLSDDAKVLDLPVNTGDPAVLKLARSWLETCQIEHNDCRNMSQSRVKSLPGSQYPKRLIDLSNMSQSCGEPVLIETRNYTLKHPYATISHCWGQKDFFTLTEDNINKLLVKIPIDELPKSFQDAIDVCITLRIKYLWIDSLCIIQTKGGINNDWLEHARTMADIYRNCILTIAIDRASNPFEGAFVERDASLVQPCKAKINAVRGTSTGTYFLITHRDYISSLNELPLSRRGWAFQERFLSPRVLHFGADRIFWECSSSKESEISGHFDHQAMTLRAPFSLFNFPQKGGLNIRKFWEKLVEAYTARLLTKPSQDKFVAFAAVAKEVAQEREDWYVAGIFLSDLPKGLLWKPARPRTVRSPERVQSGSWAAKFTNDLTKRPKDFWAPTWSWASIDDTISFDGFKCDPVFAQGNAPSQAEVLDINIKYVDSENPYGMVESGQLTMRGHVATWHWDEDRKPEEPLKEREIIVVPGIVEHLQDGTARARIHAKFDCCDDAREFDNREKIILEIVQGEGLILVKSEVQDAYMRIGTYQRDEPHPGCYQGFEERVVTIV